MAKKKEMTQEEQKLFNELKKLAKRANQRLVRLERLTGEKGLFASKQLYDYLESVDGLSEKGRVRVSKLFTETQMVAIIKATSNFLEDTENSLISQLKKQKSEIEKSIGKPITWSDFSTLYTASELYKWATETFGSEFWKDFAPKVFTMNKNQWVEYCSDYIDAINDVTVLNKLRALYDYLIK